MSPNPESAVASIDERPAQGQTLASSEIAGLLLDLTVRVVGITIAAAAVIMTSATLLGAR